MRPIYGASHAPPGKSSPPSLVELCLRVAIAHVHELGHLGALAEDLFLRILEAVQDDHKLAEIETLNPDLCSSKAAQAALSAKWRGLCHAKLHIDTDDEATAFSKYGARDWRGVWEAVQKERSDKRAAVGARLKERYKELGAARESRTLVKLDKAPAAAHGRRGGAPAGARSAIMQKALKKTKEAQSMRRQHVDPSQKIRPAGLLGPRAGQAAGARGAGARGRQPPSPPRGPPPAPLEAVDISDWSELGGPARRPRPPRPAPPRPLHLPVPAGRRQGAAPGQRAAGAPAPAAKPRAAAPAGAEKRPLSAPTEAPAKRPRGEEPAPAKRPAGAPGRGAGRAGGGRAAGRAGRGGGGARGAGAGVLQLAQFLEADDF
eukprot:tig00020927_g15999.t1